jgi:AcrR family transcriptional regulator
MSPRPRTVSDEQILEAAGRIIGRVGPARFTLADVAHEVGLSAATLVQRFGSKRSLMLALAGSAAGSVEACFERVRATHRSALGALAAAATEMARMVESPEALANHLAFLQIDLGDPDFHALALDNARRIEAGYRALLDDAVAAGELLACDTRRLARAVDAVASGSLIAWAIHRRGDVVAFVRHDLETLVAPYRAGHTSSPARRARR